MLKCSKICFPLALVCNLILNNSSHDFTRNFTKKIKLIKCQRENEYLKASPFMKNYGKMHKNTELIRMIESIYGIFTWKVQSSISNEFKNFKITDFINIMRFAQSLITSF